MMLTATILRYRSSQLYHGQPYRGNSSIFLPTSDTANAGACYAYVRDKWDHVVVFAAGNDGTCVSATGAHIGN